MKNSIRQEEQDLLAAFESGEFQSELPPSRKKLVEESAAQTLKKASELIYEYPAEPYAIQKSQGIFS